MGCEYIECSVKDNTGVDRIFALVLEKCMRLAETVAAKPEGAQLQN